MENMNQGAGEKKWMYRMLSTFLGVTSLAMLAAFVLLLSASSAIDGSGYDRTTISVTGSAERVATPDLATITYVVREDADTQSEAQDLVSKKIKAINDMLDDEGVDEEDIKTTNVSVNPAYKYIHPTTRQLCGTDGRGYCPRPYVREQIGFEASQSTRVKVRDIDDAGDIVAGLTDEGVENLYGPSLEVEAYDDIVEEVKLDAIADAKKKAEARAEALGMKLGDVVSVSDNGYYPYARGGGVETMAMSAPMADGMDFKADETEISVGENEIKTSISVTYELK